MERTYISVELAARLLGKTPQYLRKLIAEGTMQAETIEGVAGGNGGTAYRVPVDSLPYEAQILYYSGISGRAADGAADLVSYKARYGDDGLRELLTAQRVVRASDGLRKQNKGRNLQEALARLATENGITLRTLYRWEDAYQTQGITGLMRKGRSDAGLPRTMCLEARRQVISEYLAPERRAQDAIPDHVREAARLKGPSACEHCPYMRGSDNRDALVGTSELRYYPECDRAGNGILVPDNRSAINRVIASLPEEEKAYMRIGRQAWRAAYMIKATAPGMTPDDYHDTDGAWEAMLGQLDACRSLNDLIGWASNQGQSWDVTEETVKSAAVYRYGDDAQDFMKYALPAIRRSAQELERARGL